MKRVRKAVLRQVHNIDVIAMQAGARIESILTLRHVYDPCIGHIQRGWKEVGITCAGSI